MKKLEYNLNTLDKYNILIANELIKGEKRFYELMFNLNISKRKLYKHLLIMKQEELIISNITKEKASYSLSKKGLKLIPLINLLSEL